MNSFEPEKYHIWRAEFHEVFQAAIDQKSEVTVQSHLPLDLCNSADVMLAGKMLAITGLQVQYLVTGYDLNIGNALPPSPACEYSFAVDMPGENGLAGKVEYSGRAIIVDRSLQKNNLPDGLLLRVSRPNRIRQVRRHDRRSCDDGLIAMAGILLVDHAPPSRRALLALLARYYQRKNRQAPRVVNISAGGVCLETPDWHGQRLLAQDEYYLFFFFSQRPAPGMCPHVFLGKKVGIFRRSNSGWPAMRIRFLKEMLWSDPAEEIVWKNIDNEGSDTLTVLLDCWSLGEGESGEAPPETHMMEK